MSSNLNAQKSNKEHQFVSRIKNVPSQPLATRKDIDVITENSIELVRDLLIESNKRRSRHDAANRKRFARLLKDPATIDLTMSLTDEVMRISSMRQAVRTLRRSAPLASISGLGIFDFLGIKLAALVSYAIPNTVMRIVHQRVRRAANGIILPAESALLREHIQHRNMENVQLNINLLGEAVLGEHEANQRLNSIIELVQRPEVNYASVKISSIVSQLITIDHVGSVQRAGLQLTLLYRQALKSNVFINLDMEEFRDLRITVDVFMQVLSEPEFKHMNAGIVLQAYLPESHTTFAELAAWAVARYKNGGGTIKIRLVKGANLAMEKAEAELHGWVPAPYASKADVDASYARLIDIALRPEHAPAVRIGIASHNLFHLAWAIDVAKARGVEAQLDIEMLEGMANAEALAIAGQIGSVLLYVPVARHSDFPNAVAYLVRRLDENTSLENYLRASFDMQVDNKEFAEQRERFIESVKVRHLISTDSRRHQLLENDAAGEFGKGGFCNQSDADPTNPHMRQALSEAIAIAYARTDLYIPMVIDGAEIFSTNVECGIDPSAEGAIWYRYAVAQQHEIDLAVATARTAATQWSSIGAVVRAEILGRAATRMQSERAQTIAIMSRDAGKSFAEADPEVSEAIDFARYYALSARAKEAGSTPVGVVLIVPPWNFPYAIPAGGVCAALAAGNTVILKPAPESVATAWHFIQQLWRAGVPENVLQFAPTRDDEMGQYLVTHPGIDLTILTGGFETALMFTRWKPQIQLMAETSGKNSILITASADIDNAVKDLVQSAFGHAGQKCSAASLAIVDTSIYHNPGFLTQLKDAVETLNVGAGRDYSTAVGPVIHPPTGSLLRALTVLDAGESWLVTPRQLDSGGYLWSPGVKLGIAVNSWSFCNEWFGPVLGVMQAPDFATAIAWNNAGDFGLTAGIHALDVQECETWIDSVQAGNLYVNRGITGAVVNRQPFGGWKRSSVGATSKAGGANYVNNLRNWLPMSSLAEAKSTSKRWWDEIGSQAIDAVGLGVERNYQRYRPYVKGIVVRIDDGIAPEIVEYINWIGALVGTPIHWSAGEDLIQACDKVRWLSSETPPTVELLTKGISVDQRPIGARGDIEVPRWLLEQSISITNHRYGNIGAGPRPQL